MLTEAKKNIWLFGVSFEVKYDICYLLYGGGSFEGQAGGNKIQGRM